MKKPTPPPGEPRALTKDQRAMPKSRERIARLDRAMLLRQARSLAEPPTGEIEKMLTALGDDPEFEKLPDDHRQRLLTGMYNIRIQLQTFEDRVGFEEETPGMLRKPLTDFLDALNQRQGLLRMVTAEMAERRGATVDDAWRVMRQVIDWLESMDGILQAMPAEPKVYHMPKVRTWSTHYETLWIHSALKAVGVTIRKTAASGGDGKDNSGLALAARIVEYTSGDLITAEAFRSRLYRAFRAFTVSGVRSRGAHPP